jgi:endo-1,4-beta-xylanase
MTIPLDPGPFPSFCPNGYVGLSFDDGPTAYTPKLLAALNKYQVKATFFDIGAQVQKYPAYAKQEAAAGDWIGNHTWDHPAMATLTAAQQVAELQQAQAEIQEVTGQTPVLWRPPYDSINGQVAASGYDTGLTWVSWTTDTYDYNGISAAQIESNAATVPPGGILLMHDGYQTTINALPTIIKNLAARGLCAGKVVPSPAPTINGWDETFYAMVGHW